MGAEKVFDSDAILVRKDVMAYVTMVIGVGSGHVDCNKVLLYRDFDSGEVNTIRINEGYVNAVESKLGLTARESKEFFRKCIRKFSIDPNYDFMDNETLVKAVIAVRDEAKAGSNGERVKEENKRIEDMVIAWMMRKFPKKYPTEYIARRTLEYFMEAQK